MLYFSAKEIAERWGISRRRVQTLCISGRLQGAVKVGNTWAIPEDAIKPDDARLKLDSESLNHKLNSSIVINRVWAMPNKNTFNIKPINQLLKEEMSDGLWIDPFANTNKFATITNDLNKDYDTDYHMDALDFMKIFDDASVDGVLYDLPFSPRQVSECYNNVGITVTWDTTKASFWGNHKKEISRIVKVGGKVISFGWNSGGIGNKYGFTIKRILLVAHGGWHNDTICTVEIKTYDPQEKSCFYRKHNNSDFTIKAKLDEEELLVSKIKSLPNGFWDFKDTDTREYTHGVHMYPAMMVSPISRNIIKLVQAVRPIKSLFDPFSGSGTVLVEGIVANIPRVSGNDVNPLAIFLSKAKTAKLSVVDLEYETGVLFSSLQEQYLKINTFIQSVNEDIKKLGYKLSDKDGWGTRASDILKKYCIDNKLKIDVPDFKNIGYWFVPRVIIELALIKDAVLKIKSENIRNFLLVAFSETIRLVSNRRNGEFKMFRMPADKVEAFNPNVLREFQKIVLRNNLKMASFMEELDSFGQDSVVRVYNDDACCLKNVPNNFFDLVITSPPYGDSRTTVAYGEFSRLSLQWMGLEDADVMKIDRKLMGGAKFRKGFNYDVHSDTLKKSLANINLKDIERAGDVYSFYADLEKSIKAIAEKTTTGGYQFWVVGNRTVKGELLQTDIILREIAEHYGLKFIYSIKRNILNKVMPSKNSPTNKIGKTVSTMCNEHIIVLKKI